MKDKLKSFIISTEGSFIVSELVISEKGNMIIDYKPPYPKKEKEVENGRK